MISYKEIPEFPGYRFGDDGTIQSRWVRGSKSRRMRDTWHEVKPRKNSRRDYLYVTLTTPGGRKHLRVNILVLWAFSGGRPEGMEAAHKNGNRLDNRADNLEWKTHAENIADKHAHGTMRKGADIPNAVLDSDAADTIKMLLGVTSYAELGRTFGVSDRTIRNIACGKTWTHTERSV